MSGQGADVSAPLLCRVRMCILGRLNPTCFHDLSRNPRFSRLLFLHSSEGFRHHDSGSSPTRTVADEAPNGHSKLFALSLKRRAEARMQSSICACDLWSKLAALRSECRQGPNQNNLDKVSNLQRFAHDRKLPRPTKLAVTHPETCTRTTMLGATEPGPFVAQ